MSRVLRIKKLPGEQLLSPLVMELLMQLRAMKMPAPDLEFRFDEKRKWKFDVAYPAYRLGIEVQGGTLGKAIRCHQCGATVRARRKDGSAGREVRSAGGHTSGEAYERNREKMNEAILQGWTVLEVTAEQIRKGQALDWITRALALLTATQLRNCHEQGQVSAV